MNQIWLLLYRRLQVAQRSFRVKVVIFFMVAALLPLISLGLLSFMKSSDLLKDQLGKYGSNAVAQLEYQLNSELSRMEVVGELVHSYLLNPTRIVVRHEIPRTYDELHEQKDLEDFLKALKTVTQCGIYIITPSGYYYGENEINTQILRQEAWWKGIPSDYIGEYWAGFYSPKHDKSYSKDEMVLGLIVPIRNQQGALNNSRILIEMNADKLYELFHNFEKNTNTMLTIKHNSDQVIYQSPAAFKPNQKDIVWTKQVETSHWVIEARVPYTSFYKSSNVIRDYTFVGLIFTGFLALLLSYFLSARITGRIKHLKESMFLAGKGQWDTRVTIKDQDELGVLAHSFNRMVEQIQHLVDEITVSERQKKEAELRAFHYQINPHVLFNTLNSIQWKAKLQGNEDIRKMLYHLTKVLEGNLDITQELVTLRKELEVIDHFLHIQKLRYEHEVEYILEISEHLKDRLIPRMTLQPLIENIYFHAFEDGQGRIRIAVQEDQEDLVLLLEDNGKGMTGESLEKLRSGEHQSKRGRGLGVQNVNQKFKLHFGAIYGASINSKMGHGTVITIRWPQRTEDGHDNESTH